MIKTFTGTVIRRIPTPGENVTITVTPAAGDTKVYIATLDSNNGFVVAPDMEPGTYTATCHIDADAMFAGADGAAPTFDVPLEATVINLQVA